MSSISLDADEAVPDEKGGGSDSGSYDLEVPELGEDPTMTELQGIANEENINVDATTVDTNANGNVNGNVNGKEKEEAEGGGSNATEVWLPVLEVQFVCDHDYAAPTRNLTDYFLSMYQDLYDQLLPDDIAARRSSLHHVEKRSRVSDISPSTWYYSDCNATSPQLLTTLKVKGKGTVMDGSSSQRERAPIKNGQVQEGFNDESVKEFFAENVCSNMTDFRAYVDSPKRHHQGLYYSPSSREQSKPTLTFDHVDHSLLLLCGDGDLVYYEEGPPDAGFLFFGFFVGFLMVSMIATELQKYDNRPHPLGGRRYNSRDNDNDTDRGDYDGVARQEVEMV